MAEPSKPIAEGDGTEYELNPVVSPNPGQIGPTGVHVERYVPGTTKDDINNAGSDPDGDLQRSGGSPDDPDGGHELLGREWRGPDSDPTDELVRDVQGGERRPPESAPGNIDWKDYADQAEANLGGSELVKHEGIIRPEDEGRRD